MANPGTSSAQGNELEFVVSQSLGNGSLFSFKFATSLISGMSGATATAAIIPANSMILSATAIVTTAITGATSWNFGYQQDTTAWGQGLGIGQGTTATQSNWTFTAVPFTGVAQNVVLTAGGSNFTAGAVRVGIVYLQLTPFTS